MAAVNIFAGIIHYVMKRSLLFIIVTILAACFSTKNGSPISLSMAALCGAIVVSPLILLDLWFWSKENKDAPTPKETIKIADQEPEDESTEKF